MRAYGGREYTRVNFYVTAPVVARSIARYLEYVGPPDDRGHGPTLCRLSVEPWWGAPADVRRAVTDAIAEPGRPTERERRFR